LESAKGNDTVRAMTSCVYHHARRWRDWVLRPRLLAMVALMGFASVTAAPNPVWATQAAAAASAESAFVDGFEDLPLMPDLTQEPGSTSSFDSPYGRIVETYASGRTDRAHVTYFYNETLPQLGWQPVLTQGSALTFRREGEDLSISITQRNGAVTVRFQSSPH
jgi:hypothetical protein